MYSNVYIGAILIFDGILFKQEIIRPIINQMMTKANNSINKNFL